MVPLIQTANLYMCYSASLLQVIYALNTQNEEHEEFVAKLRSLHEAEVQRLLLDSTARLERCEEGFTKERESQLKRTDELKASVEKVEGERDKLHDVQVSAWLHVSILSILWTTHTYHYTLLAKKSIITLY